jgi:hypothetical protein
MAQLMSTRRIAYWWFRFVFSGRFVETFLVGRRAPLTNMCKPEAVEPQHEPRLPAADEAARVAAE